MRTNSAAYPLILEEMPRLFDEADLSLDAQRRQRRRAAGQLDFIEEGTVAGLADFVDLDLVERTIERLA